MQQHDTAQVSIRTQTFWQLLQDDVDGVETRPKQVRESTRSGRHVLTANPLANDVSENTVLAAEQYNLLRTRILQICRSQRGNVFLVTSAVAGEGKTLTAINLSYSLAGLADKRVLYVELDLRRPSAHTTLGLRSESGGRTFLESEGSWQTNVHKLTSNLDGLLAYNPSHTPNETLHKAELATFLEAASKMYDVVIVDTAPLLASIDTEAILPLVNNVLFLIRADSTPIDCVSDALALVGDKVVGLVLNGAKTLKYREYYYGYQRMRSDKKRQ